MRWFGRGREILSAATLEAVPAWRRCVAALTGRMRRECDDLYTADFKERLARDVLGETLQARVAGPWFRGTATEMMHVDLVGNLADRLLLKTDIATMASGLEARSPYLWRDLVEFAFALPDRLKVGHNENKRVLKRAFADMIPERVLRRRKMGFRVPIERWLATDLRDLAHDLLARSRFVEQNCFECAKVHQLLENKRGDRKSGRLLWRLLMLESWYRRFIG